MLHIDVDDVFVVQVIQHHDSAVVEEVHQYARPKRAGDVEHITQQHSQEHARQEPVELEVDEREYCG